MRTKRQVVVVGSEPVHSVEKHVFLASVSADRISTRLLN